MGWNRVEELDHCLGVWSYGNISSCNYSQESLHTSDSVVELTKAHSSEAWSCVRTRPKEAEKRRSRAQFCFVTRFLFACLVMPNHSPLTAVPTITSLDLSILNSELLRLDNHLSNSVEGTRLLTVEHHYFAPPSCTLRDVSMQQPEGIL